LKNLITLYCLRQQGLVIDLQRPKPEGIRIGLHSPATAELLLSCDVARCVSIRCVSSTGSLCQTQFTSSRKYWCSGH